MRGNIVKLGSSKSLIKSVSLYHGCELMCNKLCGGL